MGHDRLAEPGPRNGPGRLDDHVGDGLRSPEDGIAVLRRAVELGVNHIDTASFYRRGDVVANELVRQALSPYPDGLVIATKVGPLPGPDGHPSLQATPDQLRGLVEENLSELGSDRLNLVYLRVGGRNAPGGEPIAERFAALAKLRDEGLIRHLGISNVDAAQLAVQAAAGGPGGSPAVAGRSGRPAAGAGVDGPVVAVAVRLACGGPVAAQNR